MKTMPLYLRRIMQALLHCYNVTLLQCFVLLFSVFCFLPSPAIAAGLPDPLCNFPGCGLPPANIIGGAALPMLAKIMLNTTAALSVIFGIIGGARYVLSMGKDEEIQKGENAIKWALLGMLVALASHRIVAAVISQSYVPTGSDPILDFLSSVALIMSALLNVVLFLMVMWGGIRMVMAQGKDDEVTKGRKTIYYALGGAVLINVMPFIVKNVILIGT